jgi:hypothetical protein
VRRRGAIPSDNYIRLMLDGAAPAAFDGLFMRAIEAAGPLTPFQCLDERVLIALETEGSVRNTWQLAE